MDMGLKYSIPLGLSIDPKLKIGKNFAFDMALGGTYLAYGMETEQAMWWMVNVVPSLIVSPRVSNSMQLYLVPKFYFLYSGSNLKGYDTGPLFYSGKNYGAGATIGLSIGN